MTTPHIVFHIGAHKTATTHLQRSIAAQKPALQAAGVAFFGPRDLRGAGVELNDRFGLVPDAGETVSRLQAMARRDAMLAGATRLVLSEENFIGNINAPKGHVAFPLYRNAAPRIATLAEMIAPEGLTLCLGLRRPTELMSSAYVQYVMAGGRTPPEKLRGRRDPGALDWTDLAQRLVATSGVRELVVWRYEEYEALFPQILSALLGPAAPVVTPIAKRVHEGLSEPALRDILTAPDEKGVVEAARTRFPLAAGHPRFTHYTADEVAAADRRYADQCSRIAELPKVTFLTAPATEA